MRQLIIEKMHQIATTFGSDLFTTERTRSGTPKMTGPCCRWHIDALKAWEALPDAALLEQFQLLVMLATRQR